MAHTIRIMKLGLKTLTLASLACTVLLLQGCNTGTEQEQTATNADTSFVADTTSVKQGAQDFIQSLPNTMHLARIFKRTGISYDPALLHSTKPVADYVDLAAQATNLGVYSADMGYAIINGQNTAALTSLKAVKTLADALQLNAFYEIGPWIQKFERNVNNTDSVLAVASQLQMRSDLLLRDNGRYDVLYLSFAGGYIESMYLATALEKENPNQELITRVADQHLALGKLIAQIESLDEPDRYHVLLADLKAIHDMLLKLNGGLLQKEPEKAHELAVRELYPRIKQARQRIIAKG